MSESPGAKKKTSKKRTIILGLLVLLLIVLCFGGVLIGTAWTAFGSAPTGASLEKIEASKQFTGESFENVLEEKMGPVTLMMKRYWNAANVEPDEPPPVHKLTAEDFTTPPSGLRYVWLGHSTVIVQIGKRNILLDPVFSERSSPWQYMGPSRFHETPLAIEDLPKIDAVLISHDHYDHLDHHSIRKLKDRVERFFVPLGIKAHLEYWGIPSAKIVELDWWEGERIGELQITAVPARHFSGRSAWDRNRTLWTGWTLKNSKHNVFYSGDTAMFPGFKEIGSRLGPFDLTIIEVGAYDPTWPDVHLGPEQAVQAHLDVGGQHLFGVHWGTFNLGAHGWTEPIERLKIAAEKNEVILGTPEVGEFVDPVRGGEWKRWWPELPFETAEQAPVVSSGLE